MKKKELGITEGEVHINDCFQTEVWSKNTKVASCKNGINSGIYRVKTDEEMKANANLIADAFNTASRCGLLPSELLEQNRKLLSAFKDLVVYCRENMTNQLEPLISKANDTINKIEQ